MDTVGPVSIPWVFGTWRQPGWTGVIVERNGGTVQTADLGGVTKWGGRQWTKRSAHFLGLRCECPYKKKNGIKKLWTRS